VWHGVAARAGAVEVRVAIAGLAGRCIIGVSMPTAILRRRRNCAPVVPTAADGTPNDIRWRPIFRLLPRSRAVVRALKRVTVIA
jgi:hypothetical protein